MSSRWCGSVTVMSLLVILLSAPMDVVALNMEWTSYSDATDLPMSQKWREDMIAKMSKVDTSKLSPKSKMQYKTLWRKLNGQPGGSSASEGGESFNWVVLAPIGALIVYWLYNNNQEAGSGAAPKPGGPPSPIQPFSQGGGTSLSNEAREARLRRLEKPPPGSQSQNDSEKNAEMEMERLVQLFSLDCLARLTPLDAATDEDLKGVLQQAVQDDAALKGAMVTVLKQGSEEGGLETMLDRAMSLLYKLGPIWVLGLLLDPKIRLPNDIRNRAKKARQRLRNLVQVFLSQVSFDGVKTKAVTKWQHGIADGSVEPVVYSLQIKEAEEEAAKAASPAAQEEESLRRRRKEVLLKGL